MIKGKEIGRILIEVDGKPIDITELNQSEYESFLDHMFHLRLAYMSIRPETKREVFNGCCECDGYDSNCPTCEGMGYTRS